MSRSKSRKIVIDEGTVKRVTRADFQQSTGRGSVCLICKGAFMSCPHPYAMVEAVIDIVRQRAQFDIRI
jgi:hypothetical protein